MKFLQLILGAVAPMVVMAATIHQSAYWSLERTHKLKVQTIERQIKQQYEKYAKSNNYPKVDLNLYKKREKTEFATGDSSIQNSTNYSVALTQNLYNGGYDSNALKMAKQDSKIAQLEYENIKQKVIYEAITTHMALIVTSELLKMQKELIAHYQSLWNIVNKKAQYGDANEQVELRSRLDSAKVKHEQLAADYEFKKLKYIELTGRQPTNLQTSLGFKDSLMVHPDRVKLQNNEELVRNLLEIEKAHYQIAQDRARFLPKIDLELKAYKAEPLAQAAYITENQYSAKINLSYNLYSGGKDKIESEISRLKKLKLMAQRNDTVRDIRLKYADYYLQYRYASNNIAILERFIQGESNRYYRVKKIFTLSQDKSLLDILGALEGLYGAKELKMNNLSNKVLQYANMLLLQSKLSLKALQ